MENGKIVLLDMDSVLADFNGELLSRWRRRYPGRFYVPLDGLTEFEMQDNYPEEMRPDMRALYHEPGFFRALPPIRGALDAVLDMDRMGLAVYFCTSPLGEYTNCLLEKFQWIETHLGAPWVRRIVLAKDKTVVSGNVLVDDRPSIKGLAVPSWTHVLYDQPYNRNIDKPRLSWDADWKSVIKKYL